MLAINISAVEEFDEKSSTFITTSEDFTIELEHSLASISKWESIYEKPFLSNTAKSEDETIGYVLAMNLGPEIPQAILNQLRKPQYLNQINTYLNTKQTATWFGDAPLKAGQSREVITAEIVYYWLVELGIPFETQYWNFNRLLTLVKVINAKRTPPKKVGRREAAARQRQLNAARQAQYNTKG